MIYGRDRVQLFRCTGCNKTFSERRGLALSGLKISWSDAVRVIQCLVEGVSIASTERITGVHHTTILRILRMAGAHCARLLDRRMRNINAPLIQVDEIWSFIWKKEKRLRPGDSPEWGDAYTFVAIDAETKLVPCFRVGKRTPETANDFMADLSRRIAGRFQLTTDGFISYIEAVEGAFGADVDYAQLIKVYGADGHDPRESRQRWKPGSLIRSGHSKRCFRRRAKIEQKKDRH